MMQDRYERDNNYLAIWDAVSEGDYLWALGYWIAGLLKIDKRTGEIEQINLSDEKKTIEQLKYAKIISFENYLLLVPNASWDILIFNKIDNSFNKLTIPYKKATWGYGTAGYAIFGQDIYLFSCFGECPPISINIFSKEIKILSNIHKTILKYFQHNTKYITDVVLQVEDEIWIPINCTNLICVVSLKTEKYRIIRLPMESYIINKLYYLKKDSKILVIIKNMNKLLFVDKEMNKIEEFSQFPTQFKSSENLIVHSISTGENQVFVPQYGKYILVYNFHSKDMKLIDLPEYVFLKDRIDNKYIYRGFESEGKVYLFPYEANGILEFDPNKFTFKFIEEKLKKKEICNIENYLDGSINEKIMSVQKFLKYIKQHKKIENKMETNTVGKKIYNSFM